MEEGKVLENISISPAAFVEGGIQEACDDACSICLEVFCDSDPSTVTSCKHEFHLQCVLEWCQRSSQCPMCWQSISLKDPGSQELFDSVENERTMRRNPPRNTAVFHYPPLGDFELQHLPVSASDSELEERIIQHLAAAAAMGRARQLARRDGQRSRSTTQNHPQFLVFSTHPNGGQDSAQLIARPSSTQAHQLIMSTASGSSAAADRHETSSSNRSPAQTSPGSQDRAGPSDFQSFSETLKSRLTTLSARYKESITKSTRGWKERLFARNSSTPDPNAEARTEINQGIVSVSRMMDHLEIAEEGSRTNAAIASNNNEDSSIRNHTEQQQTIDVGPRPSLNEDSTRIPSDS
ncbi:hypothetical protein BUALT_Bualt02G0018600 [Buddleja alternifolia]|uniref:RING-type E3 ubiquitin transferase n=1 Tax=Buddleja alternifolia TaxID=168488 RepID=A0AAV6Y0X6_9LAMI|nr:hypothetical protein BUALT_Bualt02G0018600 [Buddleja alternifolia]